METNCARVLTSVSSGKRPLVGHWITADVEGAFYYLEYVLFVQ